MPVKNCFVPTCTSTEKSNPEKVFVEVSATLKKEWCTFVNIKYVRGYCYCCEDHLNLEEDLSNYEQWKTKKAKPKLKPTAKLRLETSMSVSIKLEHLDSEHTESLESQQNEMQQSNLISVNSIKLEPEIKMETNSVQELTQELQLPIDIIKTEIDVELPPASNSVVSQSGQVSVTVVKINKHKEVQTNEEEEDMSCEETVSASESDSLTSDEEIESDMEVLSPGDSEVEEVPIDVDAPKTEIPIEWDQDMNTSSLSTILTSEKTVKKRKIVPSSSALPNKCHVGIQCKVPTAEKGVYFNNMTYTPLKFMKKANTDKVKSISEDETKKLTRKFFMSVICRKPNMYLGLPKEFLWLLMHIKNQSDYCISEIDLVVTLYKIKNNHSMSTEISERFDVPAYELDSVFKNGVKVLGSFFQNMIFFPPVKDIKRLLPPAFKSQWHCDLTCIIDCIEIIIKKPVNYVKDAMTKSAFRCCNTIKYLIAYTPDGYICYVSQGFSGRISDSKMLEKTNFIDILPENAVLLSEKSFKGAENYLKSRNVKLLHPLDIYRDTVPIDEQVIETELLKHIQTHLKMITGRVRWFGMIKADSVVKNKHIGFLDTIFVIVCGLINLHGKVKIIKK